jgi:hypothetical protein
MVPVGLAGVMVLSLVWLIDEGPPPASGGPFFVYDHGMDARDYRLSDQERLDIVRLYATERMSIRSIAVTMGRSYGSIHNVLVRANATMRSRGSERGTRKTVA